MARRDPCPSTPSPNRSDCARRLPDASSAWSTPSCRMRDHGRRRLPARRRGAGAARRRTTAAVACRSRRCTCSASRPRQGSLRLALGFTVPTQAVFVPMLFAVPVSLVPALVALSLALAMMPAILARRAPVSRIARPCRPTAGLRWGPRSCWRWRTTTTRTGAGACWCSRCSRSSRATSARTRCQGARAQRPDDPRSWPPRCVRCI